MAASHHNDYNIKITRIFFMTCVALGFLRKISAMRLVNQSTVSQPVRQSIIQSAGQLYCMLVNSFVIC
jgi:hypothetical protein